MTSRARTLAQRNGRTIAAVLDGDQDYGDLYRTANVSGYSNRRFLADVHVARIRLSHYPFYHFDVVDPRDGSKVGYLTNRYDSSTDGKTVWSAHHDSQYTGIQWLGYFDSPSTAAAEITGL